MFFKKKRMIDVRELQRKGIVNIPKNPKNIQVPTDKDGFVELGKNSSVQNQSQSDSSEQTPSTEDILNFTDESSSSQDQFSTQSEGYNKREVDEKITEMDNKIYKLEQRIELLERKAGVGESSSVSPIGW